MNPILLDFPAEFYTERLFIRLPKPGDGKAVYEAIIASIAELKPWMHFVQKEQTEQDIEVNVREAHLKFLKRENLRLLVFHKNSGEFIGSSGLHNIDWDVPKFEIGCWIDSRFAGQGYMTEAVQAIADFAFGDLKARRLEIRCDPDNAKSRAIPERLSFNLDGILSNDAVAADGNGLRDTCIFSKIR